MNCDRPKNKQNDKRNVPSRTKTMSLLRQRAYFKLIRRIFLVTLNDILRTGFDSPANFQPHNSFFYHANVYRYPCFCGIKITCKKRSPLVTFQLGLAESQFFISDCEHVRLWTQIFLHQQRNKYIFLSYVVLFPLLRLYFGSGFIYKGTKYQQKIYS